MACRWNKFGQALGLDPHELNNIEGNNETCLDKVLESWLKQNYDTRAHGKPSWSVLTRAVRDPNGGNDSALADKIEKKYN